MSEHDESYFLKPDFDGRPHSWGSRHGPAICHWAVHLQLNAENVLLPDGTRGKVEKCFMAWKWWRRPMGDQTEAWARINAGKDVAWIWGEVIFSDDDAQFIDRESPPIDPHGNELAPTLAFQILSNAELCSAVQDFATGYALFMLLVATGFWATKEMPEPECCTYNGTGQLLADMRRRGEEYLDWKARYLAPQNVTDEQLNARKDELELVLNNMGWFRQPRY